MSHSVQQGQIAIFDSAGEKHFYFSVVVESVLKSNRSDGQLTFALNFNNLILFAFISCKNDLSLAFVYNGQLSVKEN